MVPEELKQALIKGRNDPVFFSTYFCGIIPHEGQVRWLTEGLEAEERTLACANRWGKSVIAAVRRIWKCIYKIRDERYKHLPDYISVNISITMDQSKIVWAEAEKILINRPQLSWALKCEPIHKPYPLIRFGNGAELGARSTDQPKNLWGHRYDDVNFDEPAFEQRPEEILPLLRTRIVDTNGQIDFTGTPNGKNWYFKQFLKGLEKNKRFYSQTGKITENPYIAGDAVARLMQEEYMSEKEILQHLEGEFVTFDSSVFVQEDIQSASHPELEPIRFASNIMFLEEYIPGRLYLTGWDIGVKRDALCGITVDVSTRPYKIVAFERIVQATWDLIYSKMRDRAQQFHSPTFYDATGLGSHIWEELSDISPIPIVLGPKDGPKQRSKTSIILNLQKIFERHELIFPFIPKLIEELTFYEWDDKGQSTDCVIALAIALSNIQIAYPVEIGVGFPGKMGEDSVSSMMVHHLNARLRHNG